MAHLAPALLPEVNFSDEGKVRHLHLGSIWIQGSMHTGQPNAMVHEYIQRMMAWLLFVDADSVKERQALQLGLGAGSLTKFCFRELGMRTAVVEINDMVVHACRGWFKLPVDSARLQVVVGDAAAEIKKTPWLGQVDALQVDLYDDDAAAPVLDSADFYADCRRTLTADGCMAVNLFGRTASYQRSVDNMAHAFGREALWAFKATREGNTVVLAQRTASRPARAVLDDRARAIQARWGLPADKWVRGLKPVSP